MLLQEIKGIKSERKDLRQFGLTVGVVLIVLGTYFFFRHKAYWMPFGIGGLILVVLGLAAPAWLMPLQKTWMTLALALGWLMTRLLVGLLFYFVVTPIGLIGRLFGHRFLDKNFREGVSSYWIKRTGKTGREDCERQF